MNRSKNKLAQAVAMALAGTALSVGAVSTASAHTMYNTFTTTSPSATDGWVYGFTPAIPACPTCTPPTSAIPAVANPNYPTSTPGWVGTATPTTLPFNYAGKVHLNWAAEIHGVGDVLTISSTDSQTRYGFAAEIDTGAGAWKDNTGTGWKHQTDIGLIQSEVDTTVRLNLKTLGGINDIFGVTVFEGMDTTPSTSPSTNYSHHGGWNNASRPENSSNPFYAVGVGSGMSYLTHSGNVSTTNYLEFFAEAGKVYSIALGGNGVGSWSANVAGYELTIAAVPIPAAVWLFGSALAGMGIIGRRKSQSELAA